MHTEKLVFLGLLASAAGVARAAPEICNGIDDDGDGLDDEAPLTWYADADGDGWGDPAVVVGSADCAGPAGVVADSTDCDDADPAIAPDQSEGSVIDGIDQDCNGVIDDLAGGSGDLVLAWDADSTFGAGDSSITWSAAGQDCADFGYHLVSIDDQAENDAVQALADQLSGTQAWIGYLRSGGVWSWSDGNPATYTNWTAGGPSSTANRNCAWLDSDNGEWTNSQCSDSRRYVCEVDCTPLTTYEDVDGDGFGDPDFPTSECEPTSGRVLNGADCEDSDPNDNVRIWFPDVDQDGYGDPLQAVTACVAPLDHVADSSDCDDGDPTLNPDTPWFPDEDLDGFGGPEPIAFGCTAAGLPAPDDCDDGDPDVNPDGTEICRNGDEDCDGLEGDDDPSVDSASQSEFWPDADQDGYGDETAASVFACRAPPDHSDVIGDCRDDDEYINPGAPEQCNEADDDCDGDVDEDVKPLTWYRDADLDGYGHAGESQVDCARPGEGWVLDDTDCDDDSAEVYPGAAEVAGDQIDQDCDGQDLGTGTVTDPGPTGTTGTTGPTGTGPGDPPGGRSGVQGGADDPVGCGCGSAPGGGGLWVLAAALVGRRRSRRQTVRVTAVSRQSRVRSRA